MNLDIAGSGNVGNKVCHKAVINRRHTHTNFNPPSFFSDRNQKVIKKVSFRTILEHVHLEVASVLKKGKRSHLTRKGPGT